MKEALVFSAAVLKRGWYSQKLWLGSFLAAQKQSYSPKFIEVTGSERCNTVLEAIKARLINSQVADLGVSLAV